MCGQFSDWGKTQSQWLSLQPSEQVEATWTGDAIRSVGTFGEGWVFTFETRYGKKKYTINNPKVVSQFDNYQAGDTLIIKRNAEGQKPGLAIYKKGEESPF